MPDYQKLYLTLFNNVTDAIDRLDAAEYKDARKILVAAQQKTEAIYMGDGDDAGTAAAILEAGESSVCHFSAKSR